ncbi:MAG: A24 family peptidase [bacterium]
MNLMHIVALLCGAVTGFIISLWIKNDLKKLKVNSNKSLHLFVETACGVLFLLVYMKSGLTLFSLIYSLSFSVMFLISVIDFKTKEINIYYLLIPASLLLTGTLLGFFNRVDEKILGHPIAPLFPSLIGGFSGGLFVFLVRFIGSKILKQEGLGEGDIYVAIIMGLILGYEMFFYSIIAAGILGILFYLLMPALKKSREIPFAPFLSLGLFIVFMFSDILFSYLIK